MSKKVMTLLEFADRINMIMPFIIKEMTKRQSNELLKGIITFPQFMILLFLQEHQEAKMCEIARCMDATTAAATGMVDRLVKIDYAERKFDFKDRRVIKIRLTDKGRELVKKIEVQRKEAIIKVFSKISQGERDAYLSILSRIKEVLTGK
jgi:DNA-binding MarR family transcriptional regulator